MPPILSHKHYDAASAFKPENLLREARVARKAFRKFPFWNCILDPDGDMVSCYHTDLYVFREFDLSIVIHSCQYRDSRSDV